MNDSLLLLSCEHAVNQVPDALRGLFEDHEDLLDSHRAYDAGALRLAEELAHHFDAPLFRSRVTRLLIDHNRSPNSRSLWSEFSRSLDDAEKQELLDTYYLPFRAKLSAWLVKHLTPGHSVLHLSVHSFTPVLNGRVRSTDIGLLFDPSRRHENRLARLWQAELRRLFPTLNIHLNAPYLGRSDCHQTSYRSRYPDAAYQALELEINQALLEKDAGGWAGIRKGIVDSLAEIRRETAQKLVS